MKSDEKDLLRLALLIYQDACARCTVNVSDLRDLMTIKSRVKSEGLSFLTITLPTFSRDFEYSLALGRIDPTLFRSFRKTGSIPAFLQGMIGLIFDRETGRILDENPRICRSTVVDSVRQICRTFGKIKLPCTPERTYKAVQGFVQSERDLASLDIPHDLHRLYNDVSHVLWGPVVSGCDLKTAFPRHGPGATAEGVSGNQKYRWRLWHERLEPFFPFLENGYSISAFDSKEFEDVKFVSPNEELPVKVTPVPKTQKGPRIIAIEPACMQYAQQALQLVLYKQIQRSKFTSGHVNFTDQEINRRLALIASKDKSLATIDLSEASDRVPRSLALEMFDSHPDIQDAVDACRSTHAKLRDGTIIGPLLKFASMGSALCFPVESMYFYTICIVALLDIQHLPVTPKNVYDVSRSVYVYGDDIIVPVIQTVAVLRYLQLFGCKVNENKTFWNGNFRESCGLDAYAGDEVTTLYLRRLRPKNRRQVSELVSWVKTGNLFYKKGYWRTASFLWKKVEEVIGILPYVSEQSQGLGRISFLGYRSVERWNRELHRYEVRAMVLEPVRRTDELDGYAALQKSLLTLMSRPDEQLVTELLKLDEDHLEQSVRRGVVALKRRWVVA